MYFTCNLLRMLACAERYTSGIVFASSSFIKIVIVQGKARTNTVCYTVKGLLHQRGLREYTRVKFNAISEGVRVSENKPLAKCCQSSLKSTNGLLS